MSIEGYARFLVAMGHQVRWSGGVYWFNAHPHIYMSFPFDREIDPACVNWSEVLGNDGWAARFPCAMNIGRPSYRLVADQSGYSMSSLSSKARNQTRRGLENCEVRPVGFEELAVAGLPLNRETLMRQGRKLPADFDDYWVNYYKQASLVDGAEAWGAFVAGELAAYLIAFRMDEVAHVLIVRSSSRFLKKYPNNALMFGYLDHSLNRAGLKEVSIGLESIQQGMDTLDHFKVGMGFRKEPIGQRIVLRPALRAFMSGPVVKVGCLILRDGWGSEKLGKLAGMLRWYAEQPKESE